MVKNDEMMNLICQTMAYEYLNLVFDCHWRELIPSTNKPISKFVEFELTVGKGQRATGH